MKNKLPTLLKLLCVVFFSLFLNKVNAQTNPNGTGALNASLRLWLDSSDKSTLFITTTEVSGQSISDLETNNPTTNYTGTNIGFWKDKSNYNSHVSNTDNSKLPSYIADGGGVNNNLPTLEFNESTKDHLRKALPVSDIGGGERWNGNFTFFIVFEQIADNGIDDSFFSNGDTFADDNHFQLSVSPVTANDFVWKSNNGANVNYLNFEPEVQNVLKLYAIRSSDAGMQTLVNGVQSDFDATLTNNGEHFFAYNINRNRNNNSFCNSRISEVIIYDRALSDIELGEVSTYLTQKYDENFVLSNNKDSFNYGDIKIHENPVLNKLRFSVETPDLVLNKIRISNVLGKIVLLKENLMQKSSYEINTTSFSKGMYFLEISTSNNRKLIKRFVIK